MTGKLIAAIAGIAAATLALTGCGGSAPVSTQGGSPSAAEVKGDISFLTNRTDLKTDGTWDRYVAEFQKAYPGVNVKIEAITNYEDDVKTRMSNPTGYGDVLLVPNGVAPDQYADFFESLGKASDLSSTYRFLAPKTVGGEQYGLALGGNANGVLYNTAVWKEAGVTAWPTTEADFIAGLKLIKEKTKAIPLYTNYKDGWPLDGQWTNLIGGITGNATAQTEMTHNLAPWTEGTDIQAIDSLLFDSVHEGLTEADPLTTNWEQSKSDFAAGKIATMVLGSWSVSQFQAAAKDAGAANDIVGFMPFPASVNGKQYATMAGDYFLAINKNSANKPAAHAWMNWMLEKSGFTDTQGMVSAIKAADLPSNLKPLSDNKVELMELTAPPTGEESLLNNIADKSQVDIWGNLYRQKLIDVARGQAKGYKTSYFAQLNQQWGDAVTKLVG